MKNKRKHVKQIIRYISLFVAIILIALLVKEIDFSVLWDQLCLFRLQNFLSVILVTFVCYYLSVITWYLAFPDPVPFRLTGKLFLVHMIGESLAQINPTSIIAGESLKAYLCHDKLGLRLRNAVVSLLNSRMMVLLSTGTFFLIAVILVSGETDSVIFRRISMALSAAVVAFFIYTFIMLKCGHGIFLFATKILSFFSQYAKIFGKAARYFSEIDKDMVLFYREKKGLFFAALIISLLHKLVGSAEYYVIFLVMGIDCPFVSCILFDTVSTLARSGAFFVPGQIGIEEVANKIMFSISGIPGRETWLTVSIIRRGRQVFWIFAGFVFYSLFFHGSMRDLPSNRSGNE